jgi:hypothetical protein
MTRRNINDYELIMFVRHLYDIHSTTRYGFVVADRYEREATDRCKRWMDAVLPPPTTVPAGISFSPARISPQS